MLFRENLHNILQDIYTMVKQIGFSGEYVENLSPSERRLYLFYYEKELEEIEKARKKDGNEGPSLGMSHDPLMNAGMSRK